MSILIAPILRLNCLKKATPKAKKRKYKIKEYYRLIAYPFDKAEKEEREYKYNQKNNVCECGEVLPYVISASMTTEKKVCPKCGRVHYADETPINWGYNLKGGKV